MALIDTLTVPLAIHKKILRLMGNRFEISIVHETKSYAENLINLAISEIRRIEALLTKFSDQSQTNEINLNAGVQPVIVDHEVFELIPRSLKISRLTSGAFDPSYGPIDKSLWNFDKQLIGYYCNGHGCSHRTGLINQVKNLACIMIEDNNKL